VALEPSRRPPLREGHRWLLERHYVPRTTFLYRAGSASCRDASGGGRGTTSLTRLGG